MARLILLLLLLTIALPRVAQDDAQADKSQAQIVALLDDEDFGVRQSAQAHLLADNTLDREAVRKLLMDATTDEQRYRLIHVAEHHVMRMIREEEFGNPPPQDEEQDLGQFRPIRRNTASVGFSYAAIFAQDNPHGDSPAISVIATMPGFPGHVHLRVGDVVLAIDGQVLPGFRSREAITSWVSGRIGVHQSGDTVVLTIVRDGKTFDLSIVCAQGAALSEMYSTDARNAAFRERPYTVAWELARIDLTQGLPKPESLTPAK